MTHFLFFVLCFFSSLVITAQEQDINETKNAKDYKNPEQFDNFYKRRTFISEWQINQLKEGAIVVRLQSNQKVIDALLKAGNENLAQQKMVEQFIINKNTMFAYLDNLTFCKVYFIYSNSSDTLMKDARSGIFLDTTLTVNPNIEMNEKFYLLAERDYAYNSSIGFVPEDSAKFVTEHGNPTLEMAVVLKNKYGHQLKKPFPYRVQRYSSVVDWVSVAVSGNDINTLKYAVDKTLLADMKNNNGKSKIDLDKSGKLKPVKIKKELTYERISFSIDILNDNLHQFYRKSPQFKIENVNSKMIPFLY